VVQPESVLVQRVLQGDLVVPSFDAFCAHLRGIYDEVRDERRGRVADYIPQLGRVDPDQFGVAVTTIDGQRMSLGEADKPFCVQSCCKPINYLIALEECGEDVVHRHVGCEPSGGSFNQLALDRRGLPHNPLINAGAIMSCALVKRDASPADRFDHVVETWTAACGGVRPGFSNAVYLSERGSADRNFALGYFMREHNAFPPDTDLVEVLEFYFQCCSIESTAASMSVMAATLASGGVCPTTGRRVFTADAVQRCLALMSSCGMYDYSGQWAFSIGLPAKSGVAGGLFVVVPNVLGLCTWSPPLDEHGNSVRGIEFCRRLVKTFNFHNYDSLVGPESSKVDPRRASRAGAVSDDASTLCWASCTGDVSAIRRLVAAGVGLDLGDYDGRTPLHLAASEGQTAVVRFLLDQGVGLSPVDRWGGTPLDDARREGHTELAEFLESRGAQAGRESSSSASLAVAKT
jgi:glutaminase